LEHKNQSIYTHSTNESVMQLKTWFLGNLGELERAIGQGQVVELHVSSNKFDGSPVILTVNDLKIEGSMAPVAEVSIRCESRHLILSTLESIFKFTGQDQHGRHFNTLHGGKVTWSFDDKIIERIPIAHSQHKFEYLFHECEDILVVRPRGEGQTSLTATMGCTNLTTTIDVQVIRPIRFYPEIIRMTPGETVRASLFKGIERIVGNFRYVDIDPALRVTRENSPEIKWETSGSEAAVFSADTLSIRGIRKGTIRITAAHSQFPLDCHSSLTVVVDSSDFFK
jgi:hypothetical protein